MSYGLKGLLRQPKHKGEGKRRRNDYGWNNFSRLHKHLKKIKPWKSEQDKGNENE